MSASIRFDAAGLVRDRRTIVEAIDLEVSAGEAVVLIGRSGAGKTTLLRMVNGLVTPTSGRVLVGDRPVDEQDLVALRRRTGYIIQDVGLLPHRTVLQNVGLVPRLRGWNERAIERAARELLDDAGLPFDEYRDRFPRTLSGGERQRVGIVRALIAGPEILLCDEPFGALDPIVRGDLQRTLLQLRERIETTVLFVTHDLREALRMGDRIALVDDGRIVAIGSADEMEQSKNPVARRFFDSAGLTAERAS